MITKVFLLFLFVTISLGAEGVIINTQFSNYTCLKNQGKHLTIIRALQSTGVVDPLSLNNIKLSNQAGFLTDIHLAVCPGKSAVAQINQVINYLQPKTHSNERILMTIQQEDPIFKQVQDSMFDSVYGNIWIDVTTNSALGCSWQSKTQSQNCDYVQQLVAAINSHGRSAGIFSNAAYWKQIVGDNCTKFNNLTVMYSQIGSNPSFSDWNTGRSFGGWKAPNVKNYHSESLVCGTRFDLLYF